MSPAIGQVTSSVQLTFTLCCIPLCSHSIEWLWTLLPESEALQLSWPIRQIDWPLWLVSMCVAKSFCFASPECSCLFQSEPMLCLACFVMVSCLVMSHSCSILCTAIHNRKASLVYAQLDVTWLYGYIAVQPNTNVTWCFSVFQNVGSLYAFAHFQFCFLQMCSLSVLVFVMHRSIGNSQFQVQFNGVPV